MEDKYTLNEIAEIMGKNKWYLLAVEEAVKGTLRNGFGSVTIKFDIRANNVDKLTITQTEETVLKPTDNRPN